MPESEALVRKCPDTDMTPRNPRFTTIMNTVRSLQAPHSQSSPVRTITSCRSSLLSSRSLLAHRKRGSNSTLSRAHVSADAFSLDSSILQYYNELFGSLSPSLSPLHSLPFTLGAQIISLDRRLLFINWTAQYVASVDYSILPP